MGVTPSHHPFIINHPFFWCPQFQETPIAGTVAVQHVFPAHRQEIVGTDFKEAATVASEARQLGLKKTWTQEECVAEFPSGDLSGFGTRPIVQ